MVVTHTLVVRRSDPLVLYGEFEFGFTHAVVNARAKGAGGANAKYDYQVGGGPGFRVAERWALQAGIAIWLSIMVYLRAFLQRRSEWRCDWRYLDIQVAWM